MGTHNQGGTGSKFRKKLLLIKKNPKPHKKTEQKQNANKDQDWDLHLNTRDNNQELKYKEKQGLYMQGKIRKQGIAEYNHWINQQRNYN